MKKFVDYLVEEQKGKSKSVKQQEKTGLEKLREDAKSGLHQSSGIDLATLKSFPEVTKLLKLLPIEFIPRLELAINICKDEKLLQGFIDSLEEYED